MLDTLVFTGLIADIALAVLLIETVILILVRRRLGRGPRTATLLWNAGAGAGLLLALRGALTDGSAIVVLLPLSLALAAHCGETVDRWLPRRT